MRNPLLCLLGEDVGTLLYCAHASCTGDRAREEGKDAGHGTASHFHFEFLFFLYIMFFRENR